MNKRYSRQELFIGKENQKKLEDARVFILGAGALGSSSSEILARAGVGKLTIVDRDYVEWSNLQRQHLFTEQNAEDELPKAFAAKQRLKEINSEIEIESIVTDVHGLNIENMVKDHGVIVDATDNFETRLIANDAAVKLGIPFVSGSCVAGYGTTFTIFPGKTPCYHCLLDHLPMDRMTCETVGVISPIVQIISATQVTEVLKILIGEPVKPLLKSIDIWKDERAEIDVTRLKNEQCPTCGEGATYPFLQFENQTKLEILCGRNAVQVRPVETRTFKLEAFSERLREVATKPVQNPFLISCGFEEHRIVFFTDGRAIVHGTDDTKRARTVYNRFLQYYMD